MCVWCVCVCVCACNSVSLVHVSVILVQDIHVQVVKSNMYMYV